MLFNVVVQVSESLNLLQILHGNRDFVGKLYQGDKIYQVNAVKVKRLLQVCLGCELALFNFKLLSQQAVNLCNDFFSCFPFLIFKIYFSFSLFTFHYSLCSSLSVSN